VKNKLLLFGAGKIGRSFIAQLFSCSHYEVVFVDVNKAVIDAINERKEYRVCIKDKVPSEIKVSSIRGVLADDEEAIINEIVDSQYIAVSVGQKGLEMIVPLLAKGLWSKYSSNPKACTDIIIAENLREADLFLKNKIRAEMASDYPLEKLVGFVETSIGKMVPIMPTHEVDDDPLLVYAEAYNTLILDKKAFHNPIPDVIGLAPKENMKAWVDRKLFIHNLGHAITAYFGALKHPEMTYLFEVLADLEIANKVRLAMGEAAQVLQLLYPKEFTQEQLDEHINDLIERFQNKALGDTVYRVGSDLRRKLAYDDRLVAPIRIAIDNHLPCSNMLEGFRAAFEFKANDEMGCSNSEDKKIVTEFNTKGMSHVIKKYADINPLKYSRFYR